MFYREITPPHIDEYLTFRTSIQGIGSKTVKKDSEFIRMFYAQHKDRETSTKDILKTAAECRMNYANSTYNTLWKTIKLYFKWLVEHYPLEYDINIQQLSEMRLTASKPTITAADIPTPEEFLKLIEVAGSIRNKAILWLLYDSCGRKTETILDLNWGDIVFDEQGAKLNLSGKTKRPRYIRLMASVEYLKMWRSIYPKQAGIPEGNAPLFVSLTGHNPWTRLTDNAIGQMMKKIGPKWNKAIGKHYRLYPHLLRHMGITHLLLKGASMQFVCMRAWGVPYSSQILTYVHISGADMDKEMAEINGLAPVNKRKSATTPLQCPNCGLVITPGITHCPDCGVNLNPTKQSKVDYILQDKQALAAALQTLLSGDDNSKKTGN